MGSTLRIFEVVRIKNNLIRKFNKLLKEYGNRKFKIESKRPKLNETTEEMYYRLGKKDTWDIIRRIEYDDLKSWGRS